MPEDVQALFLPVDFAFEPDFDFELCFAEALLPDFEVRFADLLLPFDFELCFAEALLLDFELHFADLPLLFDFELCFVEVLLPDFAPDFCLAFRLALELPFAVALSPFRLDLAAASCLRPPLSLIPAPTAEVLLIDLEPLSRKAIH